VLSKDGARCKPSKVKTKEEIPIQKITRISGGGIVMRVMRDEIEKLAPNLERDQTASTGKITAMWDKLIKWL
jgi:hypothetical protein